MEEKKKAEIWEKILKGEIEKPSLKNEEEKELVELFRLAQEVKKLSLPSPSKEFKKELLRKILNQRANKASLIKKVLLLAAAFALLLAGIATASLKSLPESPLYSIKRFIEKSKLILAPNKVTKEKIIKKQAKERLKEAEFIKHKNPLKAQELRKEAEENLRKIEKEERSRKSKPIYKNSSRNPQNQGIKRREENNPQMEREEIEREEERKEQTLNRKERESEETESEENLEKEENRERERGENLENND